MGSTDKDEFHACSTVGRRLKGTQKLGRSAPFNARMSKWSAVKASRDVTSSTMTGKFSFLSCTAKKTRTASNFEGTT